MDVVWTNEAPPCAEPVVLDAFRKVEGEVFYWRARAARMAQALAHLGAALDAEAFVQAYAELIARMQEGVRVRISAWLAEGKVHLQARQAPSPLPHRPRLVVRAWPFAPPPLPAKFAHHYALMRLAWAKAPPRTDEVVVWSWQGRVLSAAWGNLFVYHQGRWLTPPVQAGVLDGVVRRALVAAGAAREEEVSEAMLRRAEAIAITNGGVFVCAAAALEGRALAKAPVAELAKTLVGEPGWPKADA